jgi:hypothetical protein
MNITNWTTTPPDEALQLARGCYQRAILTGDARISGSDLRGRASKYGVHYSHSRTKLLNRLTTAGIEWRIATREHGLKVLEFSVTLEAAAIEATRNAQAVQS